MKGNAGGKLLCLPPVLDKGVRLLILGTMPGPQSLQKQQYYGHPQNAFWKILSAIHGFDYRSADYETRKQELLQRRVGLWDVFETCHREGASDSEIKKPVLNDFARLKQLAPALKKVLFNGGKAGSQASKLEELGYEVAVLPSTSPANASFTFEQKLARWKSQMEE